MVKILLLVFCVSCFKYSDEDEILPAALTGLLQIPPDTHYSIRAAVLRLLSQLGGWIKEHQDMLGIVLLIVVRIYFTSWYSMYVYAISSVLYYCY